MSLGCENCYVAASDLLYKDAYDANVLIIAAARNSGFDSAHLQLAYPFQVSRHLFFSTEQILLPSLLACAFYIVLFLFLPALPQHNIGDDNIIIISRPTYSSSNGPHHHHPLQPMHTTEGEGIKRKQIFYYTPPPTHTHTQQ